MQICSAIGTLDDEDDGEDDSDGSIELSDEESHCLNTAPVCPIGNHELASKVGTDGAAPIPEVSTPSSDDGSTPSPTS